MPIINPKERGQYNFTSVIYSPTGLNYTADQLQDYKVFENPTAGFESKFIDTSAFASMPQFMNWPFDIYNTPINGMARIPVGNGPFPLILFAHGNHSPSENSTPGYLYLCELLASHGFIAASIDVNFLNSNRGENDGRAIVHLEHIKQFSDWNKQSGHALFGKVDMENIMIVGHSRGGEGVGHASYFNKLDSVQPDTFTPFVAMDGSEGLGPYHFNIKAVVAIAPTDGQYVPVNGATSIEDNYFLIHGSKDNDVWTFPGHKIYDRAKNLSGLSESSRQNNNAQATRFKSLLWVHGANHNYFNSVWQQESQDTITRAEQEQILSVYMTSLAYYTLKNNRSFQSLFMNHKFAFKNSWIPSTQKLVSQYFDHDSYSLQDNENQSNTPILNNSVNGTVETIGIDYQLLNLNLGSRTHLYQETRGLRIDWQQRDSSYIINLEPESLLSDDYTHLSFRIGQSFEANNIAGADQDFNIEISDGKKSTSFKASDITDLIYPDYPNRNRPGEPRTVMQTLVIPFNDLKDSDPELEEISQIKLNFNLRDQGTLYMDDLVLLTEGENNDY